MRHDPGLDASPPVRYIMEVERSGYSSFHLPSAVDVQPPREAAARGGSVGPGGPPFAAYCSVLETGLISLFRVLHKYGKSA
jgi:hypothetical protein